MTDSQSRRLDELETRLAFLDDGLSSLAATESDYARRLLALEQTLQALRAEVTALRVAIGHDVRDEAPPPHF